MADALAETSLHNSMITPQMNCLAGVIAAYSSGLGKRVVGYGDGRDFVFGPESDAQTSRNNPQDCEGREGEGTGGKERMGRVRSKRKRGEGSDFMNEERMRMNGIEGLLKQLERVQQRKKAQFEPGSKCPDYQRDDEVVMKEINTILNEFTILERGLEHRRLQLLRLRELRPCEQ